jgi:hypothetical protein
MPVVGAWMIRALGVEFNTFTLFIDQVNMNTGSIQYHTSKDSRPRYGKFNPQTGFVTFSHADGFNRRDFTGKIRQDSKGLWVLNGTYQVADGRPNLGKTFAMPLATKTFFGTRCK